MCAAKSRKQCCQDLWAEHLTFLLSLQEWWCATGLSSWASASLSCASSTQQAGPLSSCVPRSGDSATWGHTTCGKAAFLEGCPAFFGSWYSPCCASGSIQLQALLPFGEGDFGRMQLRLSGAVCGHLYRKEAKQCGIWLDCALVTGFVNSYEPLEPVLTTTAFLSIL